MENTEYESITFRMKPGYTKKDLAEALQMFRGAFGKFTEVTPDPYFPAGGGQDPETEFTLYFSKKKRIA